MAKSNILNKWIIGGTGALLAAAASNAFAAETSVDSLLDALVKKGVLTQQEAEDIKEENTTNISVLPATKWKLSDSRKTATGEGQLQSDLSPPLVSGLIPLKPIKL
jgi:hypothetical protein